MQDGLIWDPSLQQGLTVMLAVGPVVYRVVNGYAACWDMCGVPKAPVRMGHPKLAEPQSPRDLRTKAWKKQA